MSLKAKLNRLWYSCDCRLPVREFHQKERYINYLFFEQHPEETQLVSLGNSYGCFDIDFAKSPVPTFHLCNTGEDIFETKYKYQHYVKYLKKLKCIILIAHYYLLFFDNSYHSKRRFEHRTVVYHALLQNNVIGEDLLHKSVIRLYSLFKKNISIEETNIDFGVDKTNTSTDNSIFNIWEEDELDYAVDYKVMPALNKMVDIMLSNSSSLHRRAKQACEYIIHDATERGIRVVLVIPPFYQRFLDQYRRDHVKVTTDFCRCLSEQYDLLSFYDFSSTENVTDNHLLFRDVDHLNHDGRKQFSELLYNELFGQRGINARFARH